MATQIVSYLIPLLDEADRLVSVTCQYCGATIDQVLVSGDEDDEAVVQKIPHQPTCPLSWVERGFQRMH